MNSRIMLAVALVLALVASGPVAAQLVVSTDAGTYTAGDTVVITIHNGGPSDATFVSVPYYSITNVESGVVVFGETGLPTIEIMPPGTTEVHAHDTTRFPDPVGTYRIVLNGVSGDLGSVVEATYILHAPVQTEFRLWGAVRALFRDQAVSSAEEGCSSLPSD